MKLRDFKKVLDKLSKEELNQELIYNSTEYSISGVVNKIRKASTNYYYTGEDDPSELYTKKQLIDDGYTSEDIKELEIEIPKGSYYLEI
jgi:hypothetical protein